MIPFYIFYSMFGFQRTGDQVWAFGDARGRGFLLGATAGRTTLNGEGLQHDDGHSHLLASTVPNHPGLRPGLRLRARGDRPRRHRADVRRAARMPSTTSRSTTRTTRCRRMPDGVGRGDHPRALPVRWRRPRSRAGAKARVRLVGSGAILQQALAARDLLAERFGVAAEVCSATSCQLLRRDALEVGALEPAAPGRGAAGARTSPRCSGATAGPSSWSRTGSRRCPTCWDAGCRRATSSLGTEGFGRSDTREALRGLFEIDAPNVAVAALAALQRAGTVPASLVAEAIAGFGIDPDKVDPLDL